MNQRKRIAVLVSGRGTNLRALCAAAESSDFPGQIVLCVSNRRNAPALEIAMQCGVPSAALPASDFGGDSRLRDRAMISRFREEEIDLVVCAGYDRILSDEFLAAFPDAVINLHPSLLPAFAGGMTAVDDALRYGVKMTGCTVQLLEPGLPDGGPIISQAAVAIEEDDDVDSLWQKVHELEWRLLPAAVALWCEGRIHREGRVIRISPEVSGVMP